MSKYKRMQNKFEHNFGFSLQSDKNADTTFLHSREPTLLSASVPSDVFLSLGQFYKFYKLVGILRASDSCKAKNWFY